MTGSRSANPFVAQRLLREGRALVERADRAVIRITGADRFTWLDGILTQRVVGSNLAAGIESLVLSPQGRVEYQVGLTDNGTSSHIFVAASQAEGLREFLDSMIFREEATVESADDAVVWGAFSGPVADFLEARSDTIATWRDPWGAVADGGYQYAVASGPEASSAYSEWTYTEWALPASATEEIRAHVDRQGFETVDVSAWQALRVAARRPDIDTEGDATLIPHEVDWLRSAVHLTKGCYRGQETVAKVHNLGAPPRRLVLLDLDGINEDLPEPGADVTHDGRVVGHVTVSARHFDEGPIALALVKRATDETGVLEVACGEGSVVATQQIIVPASAGHVADVPRLGSLASRRR